MRPRTMRRLINLWPPLLFSGIHATFISDDFCEVDVALQLRWYNRNYVGTQFGGSLFAMTDPWYMMMLLHNLGKDYFVWDKHATIDYIAPGRGKVTARFRLYDEVLHEIRERTAYGEKYLPEFVVEIVDEEHKLVARVNRTLYVRRKPAARVAGLEISNDENEVSEINFK